MSHYVTSFIVLMVLITIGGITLIVLSKGRDKLAFWGTALAGMMFLAAWPLGGWLEKHGKRANPGRWVEQYKSRDYALVAQYYFVYAMNLLNEGKDPPYRRWRDDPAWAKYKDPMMEKWIADHDKDHQF